MHHEDPGRLPSFLPELRTVLRKLLILLSFCPRPRFRHVHCKKERHQSVEYTGEVPSSHTPFLPTWRSPDLISYFSFLLPLFRGRSPQIQPDSRHLPLASLRPPAGGCFPLILSGNSYKPLLAVREPRQDSGRSEHSGCSRPSRRHHSGLSPGTGIGGENGHACCRDAGYDESERGEVPTNQLDPTQERSSEISTSLKTCLNPLSKG